MNYLCQWETPVVVYPKSDQDIDFEELYYDLGGSYFLATVEDVGGSPSYAEFTKVIDYLIVPIKDKVSRIDDSEVKAYCKGGRGYIVLTTDTAPYKPLTSEMEAMALATPDNLLERWGYFGPRQSGLS